MLQCSAWIVHERHPAFMHNPGRTTPEERSDIRMKRLNTASAALVFLLVLVASPGHALEALTPFRAAAPPEIDGALDDVVWHEAPRIGGFVTFYPDYGLEPVGQTEAQVAYDRENLYFAYRCYDPEPGKIKTSVTSRDNIRADDWICVNLDTFNDQQTLSCFYVNPMGIQEDSRFASGAEDLSIDMVWYSGGRIDETGYTAEVRIPLKSIRFSGGDPVTMGIIFERNIGRRTEHSTFPVLDPAQGMNFQTQTIPIVFHDLKRPVLFEMLPAVTYGEMHTIDQGRLALEEEHSDVSLTGKYGLTSDLVLDGTYNPDFSQVEADAGQVDVNLRYDLYFSEKRPFFLEGRENFRLGGMAVSELDPVRSIVYTRQIVDPVAGVKLTGKMGEKNTVASIYAADELPEAEAAVDGHYAHFPIVRFKRAMQRDGFIGGIYAGREVKDGYNRLAGIDGQARFGESSLVSYQGLVTRTKVGGGGTAPLAKAAAGGGSEEQAGYTVGARYLYETRNLDVDLSARDISEDFRADMGYVTRTGVLVVGGLARPKLYPKSEVLRRVDLEIFGSGTNDKFYDRWETFNHVSALGYLWGALQLKVKYSYSTEIFLGEKFDTGGFHVFAGGYFTNKFYAGVLYRRIGAVYYSADPYQGYMNRATATIAYQPSDKLQAELDLTYFDFYRESDSEKIYDYPIARGLLTYQLNRYVFVRGIAEYNEYREQLLTDFLASFTYIPGTVVHVGYGSIYDKIAWEDGAYVSSHDFLETRRGFFFKMSYLWRA